MDDISGRALKTDLVRDAREDERRGCIDSNVFSKVPIQDCFKTTGDAPISTRWVDINKGDDANPNYRSRWVGRDFKGNDNDRDDLFAATPPLEAKKLLISSAASQLGKPYVQQKRLNFIDIKKAYFNAFAKRDLYVQLPDEFLEPGEKGKVCGKLNFSLYGTRDAASNWEAHYTNVLRGLGFTRGLTSPCVFYHKDRDIETVVHGDDFTSLAVESQLVWFTNELEKVLKISNRGILGPEKHHVQEIRLLNRILAWDNDGIRYEADQRHAEILVDAFKLSDAKGVETPGVKPTKDDEGKDVGEST